MSYLFLSCTKVFLLIYGIEDTRYDKNNNAFKPNQEKISLPEESEQVLVQRWRVASADSRHEILMLLLGIEEECKLEPLTFEDHHKAALVFGRETIMKSRDYWLIRSIADNMKVPILK